MKILLVSATFKELEGVLSTLEIQNNPEKNFFRGFVGGTLIDCIITGVGASNTAEKLSRKVGCSRYDIVLNIGICGSFRSGLELGSLVNITSELWGDLGVEDHEEFLDLFDISILQPGEYPFTGKKLINQGNKYSEYFAHLPKVSGITVNKAHGSKSSIEKCIEKYEPDVETMESAAIFSICLSQKINFQCLRSISNFVEPRNRAAWDIEKALKNLTTEIKTFILAVNT